MKLANVLIKKWYIMFIHSFNFENLIHWSSCINIEIVYELLYTKQVYISTLYKDSPAHSGFWRINKLCKNVYNCCSK